MKQLYEKIGRRYIPVNDYISNKFLDNNWWYIPNYNNYIINSFGEIISLERNIIRKNNSPQKIYSKVLKPRVNKRGYLYIILSNLGVSKSIKIHQLVAVTFLNHKIYKMINIINHIDNNKLNNHYTNLQIVDNRTNIVKSIDKSKTSSRFVGVTFNKAHNKWRANIEQNNQKFHLGYFSSEEEASKYYEEALICIKENRIFDIKSKKHIKSSVFKGVTKTKNNRFRATFIYKNKFYSAGTFLTEQEAYSEYLKLFNTITKITKI